MLGQGGSSAVSSSPASSVNGNTMVELTVGSYRATGSDSSDNSDSNDSSSSGSHSGSGERTTASLAREEVDVDVKGAPASDKDTPPATPPLSIASPHGDINGSRDFNSDSRGHSSSDSGRRRMRSRTLGCRIHLNDEVGDGYEDEDESEDERYYGSHRAPSPTALRVHRRRAPCFALYEDVDTDSVHGRGIRGQHGQPQSSPRSAQNLLPPAGKKPPPAADGGHGCCKRRRRRCLSRCTLGSVVCLAIAHLSFKIVWWFLWQARCTEGCYDPNAEKAGSRGPEQEHLAYGGVDADGNPTGITVVWTTAVSEFPPLVEYGLSADELSLRAYGTTVRYLDTLHHRVFLHDLAPGTRYLYRCGNPSSDPAGDDVVKDDSEVDGPVAAANRQPTLDVAVGVRRDASTTLDASGGGVGSSSSESPTTTTTTGTGGLRGRKTGGVGGVGGVGGAKSGLVNAAEWSGVSSFVSPSAAERWAEDGSWDRPVSVAVVGDMGLVNAGATFDRLHQLVEDNEVDFVLHLGDIGYADDAFLERPWSFGYEDKWDAFMRRASHVFASKVPYMVVPGNHEAECHSPACLSSPRRLNALGNFAAYNARFQMPSIESGADHGVSMWYSFNLGPVHFVVIDTETDFPGAGGDHLHYVGFRRGNGGFGDQIAWLKEDLAGANEERDVRPWIVVSGHRPMYSTEMADSQGLTSSGHSDRVRKAFEPIFYENKVDVYMSGHVHAFERSLPVFDNEPYFNGGGDGSDGGTGASPSSRMAYENPAAPVHIINGAGGCIEGFTVPDPVYPATLPRWRAVGMNMVPGVGILTFPSKTEMRHKFVTSDSPIEVLDELTIRHQR